MKVLFTCLIALALAAAAVAANTFDEFYTEAVWNELTGYSASLQVKYGLRQAQTDEYLFVRSDWFDTRDTNLPFQYSIRGTTVGVGGRYWFPGKRVYGAVNVGQAVEGPNNGKTDLRAGFAGYNEWRKGKHITDLYGDLTWVDLADDTYLNLRPRSGYVLHETPDGRLWAYGVAQLLASASGDRGTENRVEAGAGIAYLYRGRMTINAELRQGYSFSGAINDRTYVNPVIFVAGGF